MDVIYGQHQIRLRRKFQHLMGQDIFNRPRYNHLTVFILGMKIGDADGGCPQVNINIGNAIHLNPLALAGDAVNNGFGIKMQGLEIMWLIKSIGNIFVNINDNQISNPVLVLTDVNIQQCQNLLVNNAQRLI